MNAFIMNSPQNSGREVYKQEKRENHSNKIDERNVDSNSQDDEPQKSVCFEKHMDKGHVQNEKEVAQEQVSSKEQELNQEEGSAFSEIDGLDREQVKKIEKTVRKLLLDSIHLSPEKFNELTSNISEKAELPESMAESLNALQDLLSKLKNIAGKSIQELDQKEVALASKVVNELKSAIKSGKTLDDNSLQSFKDIISSPEVKELLGNTSKDEQNLVTKNAEKSLEQGNILENRGTPKEAVKVEPVQPGKTSDQTPLVKQVIQEPPTENAAKNTIEPASQDLTAPDKKPQNNQPSSKENTFGENKNGLKVVAKPESQQVNKTIKFKEPELTKDVDAAMKMIKKVTVETKDEPALARDLFKKDEMKNSLNKSNGHHQRAANASNSRLLAQEAQQQEQSSDNKGDAQKGLDTDKKSLDFLKKLKNIIKKSDQAEGLFTEQPQNKSIQKNKLNFINKMNASSLVKQLVDKIDKFIKSSQSSSTTIDLQSPGLGDMKVAAEVAGSKLSLNISSLSQNIRAELIHMRSELSQDLKALGFEDVDLGFDFGEDEKSGNPFEEQMEQKRQKDPVKLPGDYLADLAEISTWLQSFNAS